jgi:serine/threonine protein kinase
VRVAISRKEDKKKVVIKQIHFDYVAPMYQEQLAWEFNILSQLKHPNIVDLLEVYREGKEHFMVSRSR